MSESAAVIGEDGRARCPWGAGQPDYIAYHDQEWGFPLRGEPELYERITLESFQSGLSWLTILRKRPAFRESFAGFAPAAVARFGEDDRQRLLAQPDGVARLRAELALLRREATLLRTLTALPAPELARVPMSPN